MFWKVNFSLTWYINLDKDSVKSRQQKAVGALFHFQTRWHSGATPGPLLRGALMCLEDQVPGIQSGPLSGQVWSFGLPDPI